MSDWFEENHLFLPGRQKTQEKTPFNTSLPKREDFSYAQRKPSSFAKATQDPKATQDRGPPNSTTTANSERNPMANPPDIDEKLKALKRLRELPRGTQVDSRIAAIENLLGEVEIFKSLKMLRWPQGVVCPRCKSTNVVRRDPPPDAADQRHFYICLNCKGEGNPSDFDDLTGLPLESLQTLRQWILCWYLIGFCSITQIAKVLGISLSEVLQIANRGSELAEIPEQAIYGSRKTLELSNKKSREAARRSQVETDEDYTRSASKSPLKPGFKSKK